MPFSVITVFYNARGRYGILIIPELYVPVPLPIIKKYTNLEIGSDRMVGLSFQFVDIDLDNEISGLRE